jgi:hypothetical protein
MFGYDVKSTFSIPAARGHNEKGEAYVEYRSQEACMTAYHARRALLSVHGIRVELSNRAALEAAKARNPEMTSETPTLVVTHAPQPSNLGGLSALNTRAARLSGVADGGRPPPKCAFLALSNSREEAEKALGNGSSSSRAGAGTGNGGTGGRLYPPSWASSGGRPPKSARRAREEARSLRGIHSNSTSPEGRREPTEAPAECAQRQRQQQQQQATAQGEDPRPARVADPSPNAVAPNPGARRKPPLAPRPQQQQQQQEQQQQNLAAGMPSHAQQQASQANGSANGSGRPAHAPGDFTDTLVGMIQNHGTATATPAAAAAAAAQQHLANGSTQTSSVPLDILENLLPALGAATRQVGLQLVHPLTCLVAITNFWHPNAVNEAA